MNKNIGKTATQEAPVNDVLSLYDKLRVKASYRNRNLKFNIFKDVYGNNVGIPCIDLSGQTVSVHLLENECLYTTVRDNKNVEIFEKDIISFNFKSEIVNASIEKYYGQVVFHDACFGIIAAPKDKKVLNCLPISEFIPLFAVQNILIINERK